MNRKIMGFNGVHYVRFGSLAAPHDSTIPTAALGR